MGRSITYGEKLTRKIYGKKKKKIEIVLSVGKGVTFEKQETPENNSFSVFMDNPLFFENKKTFQSAKYIY
jgi:hypothetical protein